MELATLELNVVEAEMQKTVEPAVSSAVRELQSFELALVGGGTVNVAFQ